MELREPEMTVRQRVGQGGRKAPEGSGVRLQWSSPAGTPGHGGMGLKSSSREVRDLVCRPTPQA